jgi:hypothetical protein
MAIYDIPPIANQPVPNKLTPKDVWISVTGIWPFNTDKFIDEDFTHSVLIDR